MSFLVADVVTPIVVMDEQVSFVKIVAEFPRTASNKLLRRVLRDQMKHELSVRSRM